MYTCTYYMRGTLWKSGRCISEYVCQRGCKHVCTRIQTHVVAQWEGLSAAPVGGTTCPPFLIDCHGPWHWDLSLARVLAALAAQELSACQIQTPGRVVSPSSHARQPCQVCQCSLSPSWPSTTSCSRC